MPETFLVIPSLSVTVNSDGGDVPGNDRHATITPFCLVDNVVTSVTEGGGKALTLAELAAKGVPWVFLPEILKEISLPQLASFARLIRAVVSVGRVAVIVKHEVGTPPFGEELRTVIVLDLNVPVCFQLSW